VSDLIWVDVFATGPLTGNQPAVLPDAERLIDRQRQRIAGKTALSEAALAAPRSP